MNYYEELIIKINDYIDNNELDIALRLINEELNMPYIPKDINNKLNELLVSIKDKDVDNYKSKVYDDQKLDDLLGGDNLNQLLGVNILIEKNLRDYKDIIDNYLLNGNNKQAKSLLIDALIRQEINDVYTIIKDDMQMEFNPRYCECIEETDSFILAYNKLKELYETDNPTYLKFGFDLLVKEYFEALPMTICEDEVEELIIKIQEEIIRLFK